MVKIETTKQVWDVDNKEQREHIVGYCLSTDEKPTEYANGSILIETDHEDGLQVYIFNEASNTWGLMA